MKVIIFVIICTIFFPKFAHVFMDVFNLSEWYYLKIIGYVPGAIVGIVLYLVYNELVVQEEIKEELIELRKSVSNTNL
jgi:hypothetical protein